MTYTDDEREALAFELFLADSGQDRAWLYRVWSGHGSEHPVKANYFTAADAVLASPVWRNRGRGPIRPEGITDDEIERVAAAIAKAADADYWTDEIGAWENSEQWERDAHPDNYPGVAYEDREFYRKQARAALEAARDAEGRPSEPEAYSGRARDAARKLRFRLQDDLENGRFPSAQNNVQEQS